VGTWTKITYSSLFGGEWSVPCSTIGENTLISILDVVVKREIPAFVENQTPVIQRVD
jgi:hypothetical protein